MISRATHLDPWRDWARAALDQIDLRSLGLVTPPPPPPRVRGRAAASHAIILMIEARRLHRRGHYSQSAPLLARALAKLRPSARRGDGAARWAQAWCHLWQAHHAYARGFFSRALELYASVALDLENAGDVRGQGCAVRGLGNVCKYMALYAQAAEHYERAESLADACGDVVGHAAARHNQGNVLLALGDHAAAKAAYRSALSALQATDRVDMVRQTWTSLASVAQSCGDSRTALRLLNKAATRSDDSAWHAGDEAERLIAVGEAEACLGRASAALSTLEAAVALGRSTGERHTEAMAHCARARINLVPVKRASDAYADAKSGLACTHTAGESTELTGELHELAAQAAQSLGNWRIAARHFERSLQERKRLATHRDKDRARTLALHAELLQARHETEMVRLEQARLEEALVHVATRLKEAEKKQDAPRLMAVEQVTAASLLPLGLRPRECDVLLWVVLGKSNDEIGTILGCSGETVKSHLKRIYAHLDVTNRTAAAARAVSAAGTAHK